MPFLALTATATRKVQQDIVANLQLRTNRKSYVLSFERPNICFSVQVRRGVGGGMQGRCSGGGRELQGGVGVEGPGSTLALSLSISSSQYPLLPWLHEPHVPQAKPSLDKALGDVVLKTGGGATLIYTLTTREVDEVHAWLSALGKLPGRVAKYHGKMNNEQRREAHQNFLRDDVDVMVATVAYGASGGTGQHS